MNDQQQEALSALYDGETSEFETRRLLAELDQDERDQFGRYQVMRDAMQGQLGNSALSINIADAVAEAIADEPVPGVEQPVKKASRPAWIKPVTGFAAAASVAFVTVLGITNPDVVNTGFIADGNVAASRMPIVGSDVGLSNVSGLSSIPLNEELDDIDQQKQNDQLRLDNYLQQHTQHSAYNSAMGLMPMARTQKEEY